MLKATIVAAYLFNPILPAFADIRQIDEAAIVKAIGEPALKKVQEEDSPGCDTTRYTFADEIFDMKIEFKCNRINVAWAVSEETKNIDKSKRAAELAKRAVAAISQSSGVEVERALAGEKYRSRTFQNGVSVSGSCVMNNCLLTFK